MNTAQRRCGTCDYYVEFRCRWLYAHHRPDWVPLIVTHAPILTPNDGTTCPAWEDDGEVPA